jgi:hypothetical protein
MKETYTKREMQVVLAVLVLTMLVTFSLLLDLGTARANEREMSRRLYESFKRGNVERLSQ